MKYYDIKQFAELVYVAPITLYKKKDLPAHDSVSTEVLKGAPKKLWTEATVNHYKDTLVAKLRALVADGRTAREVAYMASMGIKQAKGLLGEKPKVEKKVNTKSKYDIAFNQLARTRN